MPRSERHTKHWPTKEKFYSAQITTSSGDYFPEGVEIDAATEDAAIRVYVPHDFAKLEDLVLVVIPIAPADPMWIQVVSEYNIAGKDYNEHTETLYFSFTAVPDRITEIDISEVVDTVALEAGDYIYLTASRQAALPVENTDCYVSGVRLKYKYR